LSQDIKRKTSTKNSAGKIKNKSKNDKN
jgi:hypothetical protein